MTHSHLVKTKGLDIWKKYCSGILSSNKIINFDERGEIESCFINKIF